MAEPDLCTPHTACDAPSHPLNERRARQQQTIEVRPSAGTATGLTPTRSPRQSPTSTPSSASRHCYYPHTGLVMKLSDQTSYRW